MAAKKIAKTTRESAPKEGDSPAKPAAKKSAKKATKKTGAKKTEQAPAAEKMPPTKKSAARPSLDTVARAAYLNYRNRVEKGLPGDSHGDWLEAERQHSALG